LRHALKLDSPRRRFKNLLVAAIAIRDLTKVFPAPNAAGQALVAIDGVNLDVCAGELLAVVGPSGCGKTTLLRLIAGLEEPARGSIAIAGREQRGIPPGDRDVAMVFQNLALYPHMTVARNLSFGLELRRLPASEISARVASVAALLGITGCLPRRPAELSGGQRQRVAIGRALVRQPKILLLDEPFANLDAPLRRELRRELLRLHRELQLTVLLVTHDQPEALALGQRVAVMNSGRLEQVAAPDELRARPASEFVRAFLAPEPV
jgi:ABC-type sugar transport system ATPase subunit